MLCICIQHSFAATPTFKLIDKTFEDGGDDEPSYTTYRYQSNLQPLQVKYVYRHNIDLEQDELTIQLDPQDTINTKIYGLLSIHDGLRFLPLLHLQNITLDPHCQYTGHAEVQINEVEMVLNEAAGDADALIDLKSFRPLTSPEKSCPSDA